MGAGFAGLNAAKALGNAPVDVVVVDRRNHHLFQPLLYQVAMAGLNPADISAPIRSILSAYRNVRVLLGEVRGVRFDERRAVTDFGDLHYDKLVLCCGADNHYFGHDDWRRSAPGLKSIEEATEIRRRVLAAFEEAEKESDDERQRRHQTFVVVGGGPTGVELAGAIAEMARFTLARDFRRIDPTRTRVVLLEAGPRILSAFDSRSAARATRDLASLGVEIRTSSPVSRVDPGGVTVGEERLDASTVLWAAGVRAAGLAEPLAVETDRQGRVVVEGDLSLPAYPDVFVVGDQARCIGEDGEPLPGLAPVALQQGRFVAKTILGDARGETRSTFRYADKGQLATIGRRKAVAEIGRARFGGFGAWLAWLIVHIYYLTGFRNRIAVILQWAWSYFRFRKGARLITRPYWDEADR